MKRKLKEISTTISKAITKGVNYIVPFAVSGGVLISFSYIIDIIFGADSIYGLGSSLPFATILKSIGTVAFSLMLPVLSGVIAANIYDKGAFTAGIVGGFLAQNGASLSLPFGDTRSSSGVIGAIIAGVAAGYIYKLLKRFFNGEGIGISLSYLFLPIISVTLISLVILLINPATGLLNTILSLMLLNVSKLSPVIFGIILGLMTALDMGGAFMKSAFIFATAAIASGEFTAMAAVMAANVSIPLSVFLASMIFKTKFTSREAEICKTNLVFGICGITEGTIPILAKSPFRVIPGCAIAAGISAGMSAGFGCTLISPFGGLLVLPAIGRPLMFLLSVFTGVLGGCVAIGLAKKECRKFAAKVL